MKITFKLFANLSELLPPGSKRNQVELNIDPDTSVAAIIEQQRVPPESAHLVMINGVFVAPGERTTKTLIEGDELAIWPPVAGG